MHATLNEALQSVLCAVVFALFLVPPGYVAARLCNLNHFRERSRAEQILWSIALSLPLAILLAELLGRVMTPSAVVAVFGALAVLSIVLWVLDARRTAARAPLSREAVLAATAALILAAYLILTLIDIQVGSRLFVPTVITDWGVRVPLVGAAIRGPVPPLNPLSALQPVAPPLRYYYFWYVLTAVPARFLHTPPSCALIASSVWAGFALLSFTFLAYKYLVASGEPVQRRCLKLLLPMLVIGLDLLPAIAIFLSRSSRPYLDIEWWHPDRTPALLTALVYAPHHIGGLVCCFVGYLVLIPDADHVGTYTQWSWRESLARAVLAGAAFAACVGTSTFLAFIFVLVSLFWMIDLLRSKQFAQIGVGAIGGAVAYLLSRPYLHELKSGSSAAHGFASFVWRSSPYLQEEFARRHLLVAHPLAAFVAQQPIILLLDFSELGFFAFVAVFQIRRELLPALRGKRILTRGQSALWAVFAGAAVAWLFVSSSATSSGNDLGGHAGMLMRFVLVLWSPAYLQHLREQRRTPQAMPLRRRIVSAAALACFVIGLAGGLFDAAWHRVCVPLFDAGIIKRPNGNFFEPDHLAQRLYNIHAMWQQLDARLPVNARVEGNPIGAMQMAIARYSDRQFAASDGGCGTAFGGDYDKCAPVRAELRHLFDDEKNTIVIDGVTIPGKPETLATVQDFTRVCNNLWLSAVLVDATDPVWNQKGSWVWQLQPMVSEPTVRAYRCPAKP